MMIHQGTKKLETPRLILRKFSHDDAGDMFKNYAADERVTKFLNWQPYHNIEEIRLFLDDTISAYDSNDTADTTYHWAIQYHDEIIGSISAMSIDEKNHSCEIGYCIGFEFWNKGITSEALYAVMHFLFHKVKIHRIMAKHDVENAASGKAMCKCGMIYEGRLREYYLRHNETFSDSLVYGILCNDFCKVSAPKV